MPYCPKCYEPMTGSRCYECHPVHAMPATPELAMPEDVIPAEQIERQMLNDMDALIERNKLRAFHPNHQEEQE